MRPATGFKNPNYKQGSKTPTGATISKIYETSPHYVIYESEEYGLGMHCSNEVALDAHAAIARVDEIQALLNSECPEYAREALHSRCAAVLGTCFSQAANGDKVSTENLDKIVAAVYYAKDAQAKRTYIKFACLTWVSISIVGFLALWAIASWKLHLGYFPKLLLGAVCGSAGGLLSVLISCNKIELSNELTTPEAINYQGAIRIVVGCFGGALAMAAIDSDQLFPWAKGLVPATVFICAAAGFVERMIPDLFSKQPEK